MEVLNALSNGSKAAAQLNIDDKDVFVLPRAVHGAVLMSDLDGVLSDGKVEHLGKRYDDGGFV